jgi:CubicO group peptidase (beta-lactamase class C family)
MAALLCVAVSVFGTSGTAIGAEPAISENLPEGISREGLEELKQLLEETKTRAAIVLYQGQPIAEWYWHGSDAESSFEVWSTSKSYASTCIGLLIDEGKIASIDEMVSKYVPSWNEGHKAKVTIAHLLDQTSGLEESGSFVFSPNQLELALGAKILTPPGEKGRYNNAACNVLSAVISSAAGKDPEAYMREKLWKPLGMDHTSWRRDKAGNVITYAGIQSTASDLARFGQLFHDQGVYEGRRLLSKEWIQLATNERTQLAILGKMTSPYGLLWWLDFNKDELPHNYSALGLFGNNLTVIPELNLVGVRLVGNNTDGAGLMSRTPEWVAALAGVATSRRESGKRESDQKETAPESPRKVPVGAQP